MRYSSKIFIGFILIFFANMVYKKTKHPITDCIQFKLLFNETHAL